MTFTYTWFDQEETMLEREDADGNKMYFSADPLVKSYGEYLASGAEAAPYVAPPEPEPLTTEEKVDRLLSDYGLTRDEMRAALAAKATPKRAAK